MIRLAALTGLLLLAGCHRDQAALTPDADAETRNATAAKALADIAAAQEASRTPLPRADRPRVIKQEDGPSPPSEGAPLDNGATNETTPSPQ